MSAALTLLHAQVQQHNKTLTQIADEIGYSRTAVSLYHRGKYAKSVEKLEAAILRAYDRRHCPHLNEPVEPSLCARKALTPKPFGGSARLAWWKACQQCPHKPATHQEVQP